MDIKKRELKIKEKRKVTPRREFVMEIGSRFGTYLGKKGGIISRYPDTGRIGKIVSFKDFEKNRDQLIDDGKDYDHKINFFDNFHNLIKNITISATLVTGKVENSDFSDDVFNVKNVYLSFAVVTDTSDVLYSTLVKDNTHKVLNSVSIAYNSENIYMCTSVTGSFNIFYSKFIVDSSDIRFSSNLIGCTECLFCSDLQNKSYYIKNKQYQKDEYKKEKENILKQKKSFLKRYINVSNIGNNLASESITGNDITKSTNIENGITVYQVEKGRNLFMVGGTDGNKNMYDVMLAGSIKAEEMYATIMAGVHSHNIYCSCHIIDNCSNIYYSHSLDNCSYCLGCFGLKNKSFCILNKQYSKEERFELANKIFQQMDTKGILGQFFPGYINPFYFNDTFSYLLDSSFTKEEITSKGYLRRDEPIKVDIPTSSDIITNQDIENYQRFTFSEEREINPEILKKVIKDEKGNYYRIVPMELEFLQKHGLPLPEIHWLDRIKLGFKFK